MELSNVNIEKELKIVFMGTPEFSVPVLEGLIENYKVRAVVTQPDKKIGREGTLTFPPIKKLALKHDILVIQPIKIKEEFEEILSLEPDLIITCAYGQILPKEILDYPKYGCINVHASLLPKLRGGAPIHRSIINGHSKTGITIMYMAESMDSGDIITQNEINIDILDTASSLHDKLSLLGKKLLLETLPSILNKTNNRTKQNEDEVTYAFNIKPEDERIDFSKTKKQIYNQIRGLNSWPGSYCLFEGKRLKVWASRITDNYFPEKFDGTITSFCDDGIGVKVSNGEIVLTELQLEGKKKVLGKDFINGFNKEELLNKVLD